MQGLFTALTETITVKTNIVYINHFKALLFQLFARNLGSWQQQPA
jgi:hypothetical protein